jgi:hypothetical protein
MGRIVHLGVRQAEAVREALMVTLSGSALPPNSPAEWLQQQGFEAALEGEPFGRALRLALSESFQEGVGEHPEIFSKASDAPEADLADLGSLRAGAGWSTAPNFVITSAFVRLLGALEQFELDTLKALLYYRPYGLLGDPTDQIDQDVERDVLLEVPEVEGDNRLFTKPALWTWIRKHAENNNERRKIFSNVFRITTIPPPFKSKQKDEWYEKRNAIAHGRHGVTMTLSEYSDVDVFVAKSMQFIRDQCKDSRRVLL